MTEANRTRRSVMLMAWDAKRAEPTRAFGDCLRGAWALNKRMAKAAAKMLARAAGAKVLRLSPSLIRSPLQRVTRGQRFGRYADFQAAYTTAVVGA